MQELDVTGLSCPLPVLRTNKVMKSLASGDTLRVTASDEKTLRDIPEYCTAAGHTLIESSQDNGKYLFVIQKG